MDYFYDTFNPGIPNVRSNIRIPPKMAYAVELSLFALKDFVHVFDFFQYDRNCVHVFDFFQYNRNCHARSNYFNKSLFSGHNGNLSTQKTFI